MIILLSLLIALASCYYIFTHHIVSPILALGAILYCVLWLITPGVTAIILHVFFYNSDDVFTDDIGVLYLLESATCFCSIITFVSLRKRNVSYFERDYVNKPDAIAKSLNGYFFWGLSSLFILVTLYSLSTSTFEYHALNDLRVAVQDPFRNLLIFVQQILLSGLIYICLIENNIKRTYTAFLLCLLPVFGNLAAGSRIGLITPIFIGVFILMRKMRETDVLANKVRVFSKYSVVLAIALGAFMTMSVFVGHMRQLGTIDVAAAKHIDISARDYVETLLAKFDSFSTGHELIEVYGAGAAGFAPYRGSIVFFIPRIIYENKPIAGSINDSYFGVAGRLVPLSRNARDTIQNVGISPLAAAIWHWGWIAGPIVFWVSSVLNFFLVDMLLRAKNIAFNVLGIYIMEVPTFLGVFPSPEVFVKYLSLSMAVFLLYSILKKSLGGRI